MARILLADDQAKVRSALRLLLEQEPSLHIVVEAADVAGVLEQLDNIKPDLVLLDWELPGSPNGCCTADLLYQLRRKCPDLSVIVMSSRPEAAVDALSASANAFVFKGDPPEILLQTIRSLSHDNPRLD